MILIRMSFVNIIFSLFGFIFSFAYSLLFVYGLANDWPYILNEKYGISKVIMTGSQLLFSISYSIDLYLLIFKNLPQRRFFSALILNFLIGISWIFFLFYFSHSTPIYGIISFFMHAVLLVLLSYRKFIWAN